MTQLDIHQFFCLKDNFGVLVHDRQGGVTVAIDAPDAGAVMRVLDEKGWSLTHILVTHHHADHTAGIADLKAATGCTAIGPRAEGARIPGLDTEVAEPDTFSLGSLTVAVLDTPGHTLGHVSYWLPEAKVAFVGDTLFAMGCGRILEGNAEMMWASLKKIAALPPDTVLYCGHEYTVANGRFGLSIEPENAALKTRLAEAEALRAEGRATLPTRVDIELLTNVFLRANEKSVREELNMLVVPGWKVFAEVRERKNRA